MFGLNQVATKMVVAPDNDEDPRGRAHLRVGREGYKLYLEYIIYL